MQVMHLKQEKAILDEVTHPFMVNLFGAAQVSLAPQLDICMVASFMHGMIARKHSYKPAL